MRPFEGYRLAVSVTAAASMHEPDPGGLPELLRTLHAVLAPHGGVEAVGPVLERLDRDLLPRTAGGASHLVVGIVGPNNAGKSALFNALVGRRVSPSLATGGATRRLVGAAHPDLLARLEGEPSLARFPLRRAAPGPDGVELALASPDDAAELVLVESGELEDGVLLVDAPDFDSINARNRTAAEALVRVTDLALCVVTRHTYQNRDVVAFLQEWLAHGRPWLCVYNEALGEQVTAEHVAKLAEDVGAGPAAVFTAPFSLDVAEGRQPLVPLGLAGRPEAGVRLGGWLLDHARTSELKQEALSASLGQLEDELVAARAQVAAARDGARAVEEELRQRALVLGREVAGGAMPMGPFLEAFRAVLDRRPSLLQRGLRGTLRRGRLALGGLVERLRGGARAPAEDPDARLVDLEREALEPAWPPFFEDLAVELPTLAAPTTGLDAPLASDLAPGMLAPAGERARAALAADPEVLRAFREACEELIEAELGERGDEWMLQLAVDAVHLLPAVAAGVVIVQTGGLGADVAVGSAGAVSSLLAERVSRLLGTQVAGRARRRWAELRGARVAEVALEAALPSAWPAVQAARAGGRELVTQVDRALEELRT